MEKNEWLTLWRHQKISKKKSKYEIFEQCHSAENCKRGAVAITETVVPFSSIQKFSNKGNKSHSAKEAK